MSLKKVEGDKMSADREYSDEEERMVATVGGRARGLVQAVRRIQRESRGDPTKFRRGPIWTSKDS